MAKSKLTEEEIREAAYHKWLKDGAPEGKDQDYWFKAEQELAAPAKKAPAKKAPAQKAAAKPAAKKAPAKKAAPAKGKAKS